MTTSPATTSFPAPAAAPVLTRAQRVSADITSRLKARNTLLWVVTGEERRVENAIIEAAAAANFRTLFWDCASGITGLDEKGKQVTIAPAPDGADPDFVLRQSGNDASRQPAERRVYVLRDFHKWIANPITLRALRNRAAELSARPATAAGAIIVLAPTAEIPPELREDVRVITFPIPDRAEMAKILDGVVDAIKLQQPEIHAKVVEDLATTRDAAIDAAVGLSAKEATTCYAHSLVTKRRIDVALVSAEKKSVIERAGVLTWFDPDPRGFAGIGGYENVKGWLALREQAFSERARAYGLPEPKGLFLVGVAGCGKSLTPKCVAGAWRVPLLRLDMGALRSKYVGESEANIRKALQVAEAVGRCVLWLDEIEKALAGSTGDQGDGGVSADALGALLTWMQERKGSVFVIATANDVSKLPPELTRKGRFDETFFVDVPTTSERTEILSVSIKARGRAVEGIDLPALASATEGFTGAELDALVPEALFTAFADGERTLTTSDLVNVAKQIVPLTKTAAEKIKALREWASERARPASKMEAAAVAREGGSLDF